MEESAIRRTESSAVRASNAGPIKSALSSPVNALWLKYVNVPGVARGFMFVNRSHEIGHISGRAAGERSISHAQIRRTQRTPGVDGIPVSHLDREPC